MAYIAAKSVKFDRAYSIGETIPDAVIDPSRVKSLIEMGRIIAAGSFISMGRLQVGIPDDQGAAESAQEHNTGIKRKTSK